MVDSESKGAKLMKTKTNLKAGELHQKTAGDQD